MERELVKRLAGDASTHYRSTDHSGEIAWLRLQALDSHSGVLMQLAYAAAADLLECHDAMGIVLDDWDGPRDLVEHMLQRNILRSGV